MTATNTALECVRCGTDTSEGWVHTDAGWICGECWVPDAATGEPVRVDVAVMCAGGSVTYPTWHDPETALDCGACAADAAREQAEEWARDAEWDRG